MSLEFVSGDSTTFTSQLLVEDFFCKFGVALAFLTELTKKDVSTAE